MAGKSPRDSMARACPAVGVAFRASTPQQLPVLQDCQPQGGTRTAGDAAEDLAFSSSPSDLPGEAWTPGDAPSEALAFPQESKGVPLPLLQTSRGAPRYFQQTGTCVSGCLAPPHTPAPQWASSFQPPSAAWAGCKALLLPPAIRFLLPLKVRLLPHSPEVTLLCPDVEAARSYHPWLGRVPCSPPPQPHLPTSHRLSVCLRLFTFHVCILPILQLHSKFLGPREGCLKGAVLASHPGHARGRTCIPTASTPDASGSRAQPLPS